MTQLEIYEKEINEWWYSPKRLEMIDAHKYYIGEQSILCHRRLAIGPDGKQIEITRLPNNRLIDNQYAKHVDQKTNYLLGKPITFQSKNKEYAKKIKVILGKQFMRTLKRAGTEALNSGIAWIYPFINEYGLLDFKLFSGYEILPFWRDNTNLELESACRLYFAEVLTCAGHKIINKVDIFSKNGISTYQFENNKLSLLSETQSYVSVGNEPYNWTKIPLIPIKYSSKEIPLIRRARSLQDAINSIISNFTNNMQEDIHNTILVLKNYDGQDLGEFRQNLAAFGACKVRTIEGSEGGIDSLELTVNANNYKTVLKMLKSALIENMRSFDGKDERLSGQANQMNIQSLLADIDLDANDFETELQASFEEILWFVNVYLYCIGAGDYFDCDIDVIFNRDTLINETEAINNCTKSVGIISDETIISQHPWVNDPIIESDKMRAQKKSENLF